MEHNEAPIGPRISNEIVVNHFSEIHAQLFRDQVLAASAEDPNRPIVVYIDSYGGELDGLAKMLETMDEVPNPIITVVMGKAISAGAVLLSHGDIRFCSKHSRIMVHEASVGVMGDIHDVEASSREAKRQNTYFMEILAKNCDIDGGYEALRQMIKIQDGRDRYFNAEEALQFGLVDVIGTPQILRTTLYKVEVTPPKDELILDVDRSHDPYRAPNIDTATPAKKKKKRAKKKVIA